jgi:hypothetical protein
VAPVALYPDPLLALILPASTSPSDVSAAAAYLVQYGDVTQIDSQPWDPSVRALAHYPSVLTWMASNLAWTEALGSAFLASPSDVMDDVQSLRARALAAGTLASTPQERIVTDDGQIEILPAQPDSVYVPAYDTDVVYSDQPYYDYGGPFINYGDAYPAGLWLSYWPDWRHHRVWAGVPGAWTPHQGWNPPRAGNGAPPGAHAWTPSGHGAPPRGVPGARPPAPRPMPGTPNPPPEHYKKPSAQARSPAAAYPAQGSQGRVPPQAAPMERPRLPPEAVAPIRPEAGGERAPALAAGPNAPAASPAPAGRETGARPPAKPQAAPAHPGAPRAPAPQPAPPPDAKSSQPEK